MDSKYKIITFCASIIDHCNLNCAGCNHYAPIAEKYEYPLDKFEINIKQLSKISEIKNINIAGGEPLLNKNILEYIKIVRYNFPNTNLEIRTNGLLLDKMNSMFFDTLNKLNCKIRVSFYSIYKTKKNYLYKDKSYLLCNYLSKIPNNNSLQCGFYKDYRHSIPLVDEDGNIHYCLFSYAIKHYNKYFNTNIPSIKGLDYNNIFDDDIIVKSEKLHKIKRPFCYYCHIPTKKKWHLYNKNLDYWSFNND